MAFPTPLLDQVRCRSSLRNFSTEQLRQPADAGLASGEIARTALTALGVEATADGSDAMTGIGRRAALGVLLGLAGLTATPARSASQCRAARASSRIPRSLGVPSLWP